MDLTAMEMPTIDDRDTCKWVPLPGPEHSGNKTLDYPDEGISEKLLHCWVWLRSRALAQRTPSQGLRGMALRKVSLS